VPSNWCPFLSLLAVPCTPAISLSKVPLSQGVRRLSRHGIHILGVPAQGWAPTLAVPWQSWQEQAPRAVPNTHSTSSGDHCTAHCGCKDHLNIAKHNVCCETFPLLSLPPASWSVTPALLSYLLPPALPFSFSVPTPTHHA